MSEYIHKFTRGLLENNYVIGDIYVDEFGICASEEANRKRFIAYILFTLSRDALEFDYPIVESFNDIEFPEVTIVEKY